MLFRPHSDPVRMLLVNFESELLIATRIMLTRPYTHKLVLYIYEYRHIEW